MKKGGKFDMFMYLVTRTTNDGGEDGTWRIISSKPGLAHACKNCNSLKFKTENKSINQ